uniref:Chromodomain helicase DNA binding protein 1-like n=1 Tax=Eptatretus burgeri TaxID=7764 RepID=A0A8C4Q2G6_EPTBU
VIIRGTNSVRISRHDSYMIICPGVVLRSYQRDGVDWMIAAFHRRHGAILADEMGLGKTCQTIAFLAYLSSEEQMQESHLVLSPLSVLHTWKEEFAKVVPSFSVKVYNGDKDARLAIQQDLSCQHFDILLTTYEVPNYFLCSWGLLVVDEGHRLKNVTSLLREALLEVPCASRILLTGTPVQNSLNELHSLLSFVAPLAYPPREEWRGHGNNRSLILSHNFAHMMRHPYLLRRVKADVAGELPPRSEVVLFHGLSTLQTRCYRAILARDMGYRARLLNTLMQLRKCVCHPYLFDGIEPEPFEEGEHIVTASGKLVILDRLLAHLQASGHRVLLFSQMTRMLDILQDYLEFRGYSYERLDGSMRSEERHLAIKSFSRDACTFVFLLSTRAGGVGLTLTAADTVIFSDSDFNPQNDLQAAARAHRLGQERPVKIIRLVSRKTVEEAMLKRAVAKLALSQAVVGGSGAHRAFILFHTFPSHFNLSHQLMSLLTIGLDSLLEQAESPVSELDLESVLGRSNRGCWVIEGDTNYPAGLGEADEIDDSGCWGHGGIFRALDSCSPLPHLGYSFAGRMSASVHLPRIGHATPAFNWYGTERLIRKHLTSCGIPTFIYYYPRKMLNSVEHTGSDSPPTSLSSESGQDVPQTSKRLRTSTDCSCTTTASLPDFMAGIKVHFVDLPPEQQHQLSRYLIAYPFLKNLKGRWNQCIFRRDHWTIFHSNLALVMTCISRTPHPISIKNFEGHLGIKWSTKIF